MSGSGMTWGGVSGRAGGATRQKLGLKISPPVCKPTPGHFSLHASMQDFFFFLRPCSDSNGALSLAPPRLCSAFLSFSVRWQYLVQATVLTSA